MKKLMILSGALATFAVCAKVPVVSDINMTQAEDSRLVTITYNLANATAVVTLDIQTNVTGNVWASIGGENIQNVSGDVWKKVETGDNHKIIWHPDLSWPNHQIDNGGARAVVTAWSVDNPPDYMVVNLAANSTPNSETYYPAVEFLPGGLLGNPIYRTSQLVMRKISAQGVTWEMGTRINEIGRSANETMHIVTLTNNYYIAVFETTQSQWALVQTAKPWPSVFSTDRDMRPVEKVSYNDIRSAETDNSALAAYDWPNAPNSKSFLGVLRTKTGLAFDLPSEAQWEYACRAGHGSGYWGDGTKIDASQDDENLHHLGRFQYNGGRLPDSTAKSGYVDPDTSCSVTNGPAIVGSYSPNSWGLYDMHGNVWEWCLDRYEDDIKDLGGAVNTAEVAKRTPRGGSWNSYAGDCRAARRYGYAPGSSYNSMGFRLALPASPALKTAE